MSKLKTSPQRLKMISHELDNLAIVAMRMGYSFSWFSPQAKHMIQMFQQSGASQMLSGVANLGQAATSEPPTPVQPRSALALEDGSAGVIIPPVAPVVEIKQGPNAKRSHAIVESVQPTEKPSVALLLPPMNFQSLGAVAKVVAPKSVEPSAAKANPEMVMLDAGDGCK